MKRTPAPALLGWPICVWLVLACLEWPAAADSLKVKSPDGKVVFTLFTAESPLSFAVQFRGQPVVEKSALGISLDEKLLTERAVVQKIRRFKIKETYAWRGVHSRATNHCQGARIDLLDENARNAFAIEIRAFNDGVAFRHVITGDSQLRVPDESTRFLLPDRSVVWWHGLGGHYEDVYATTNATGMAAGTWAAPPVTFKLPDQRGYAAITEAALVNYSGMALQSDGQRAFQLVLGHKHPISYPFRLRYSNDVARVSIPAAISGTITSPWRVILVGPDLNTLVNSDLVPNLCPAPDAQLFPNGMAADWIKPGRAVWKYLDGGSNSFEQMKDFSRWAGELGFEYHVIEGFWSRWSDEQIKQLVDYSRERGVGLWFWRHSRQLRTPEARAEFFEKLQRLGVVGAKIDFFDHEHREVVDLYTTLLRDAARHRILVNFHGANKPTGEPRTWPNELIREGVRGMESSRLQARARHNTTLPFTRFLAGHADYTPVHFGQRRGDTTWAHQVATAAVFTEPLLTYGAHPTNLLSHPALPMIKSIPAVWDETRVLPPSEIGELAAFARRHGNQWYLAVLNGPNARKFQLPLSFLPRGRFAAMIVSDKRDDAAAVEIETTRLSSKDSLELDLGPGGGFIAKFAKE